jgi:capsular exopolysaccharide synthesis family protein
VTANLAVAIARSGSSVAVLEGDLRRPRLDHALGLSAPLGLTNVLVGMMAVEDALVDVPLPSGADTASIRLGQLSFLPSGPLPPNPSELLSSPQMTSLLDRIAVVYDHVLIDSPPLLAVADGLELARMVDGIILVVRRNRATIEDAREVRSTIGRLGLHLVGTVFTDVEPMAGYGYGAYGSDTPAERRQRAAAPAGAGDESG